MLILEKNCRTPTFIQNTVKKLQKVYTDTTIDIRENNNMFWWMF